MAAIPIGKIDRTKGLVRVHDLKRELRAAFGNRSKWKRQEDEIVRWIDRASKLDPFTSPSPHEIATHEKQLGVVRDQIARWDREIAKLQKELKEVPW